MGDTQDVQFEGGGSWQGKVEMLLEVGGGG